MPILFTTPSRPNRMRAASISTGAFAPQFADVTASVQRPDSQRDTATPQRRSDFPQRSVRIQRWPATPTLMNPRGPVIARRASLSATIGANE